MSDNPGGFDVAADAEAVASCAGFEFGEPVWGAGTTNCQRLMVVANSNNPGSVTYAFNGGEFSGANAFECGSGEHVQVIARDGLGCEVTRIFSNTVDLEKVIWQGASNYIPAVTQIQGIGPKPITVNGRYPAQFWSLNNPTTTWEGYVSTNELARLRGGTAAKPNSLRLIGDSIDHICAVELDWQINVTEAHTLQPADVLSVFLEFKADGAVVEKRLIKRFVDDFSTVTASGSVLPAAGATSVNLLFESNTQGSTREHRVYMNANTFIKQRGL